MFSSSMDVTQRTCELSREVIEFQRATKPLVGMMSFIIAGAQEYGTPEQLVEYFRDVQDHAIQMREQVPGMRELLQNIVSTNLAVVSVRQNEEFKCMTEASLAENDEVKRISSWAAIFFAPTFIGTVYGMKFDMPETPPDLRLPHGAAPDGRDFDSHVRVVPAERLAEVNRPCGKHNDGSRSTP